MPRPSAIETLLAAAIVLASPMLLAQSTSAPVTSFDVATIKPHPGPAYNRGLMYQPDGYTGTVMLPELMQYAYSLLNQDQVSGAPDWVKNDWFDVQVKISEADIAEMKKLSPAENNARRALMMQELLAERFKLKVHSETRQVPVYELVVAKGGSKLKDVATDTAPNLEMGKDGKPETGLFMQKRKTSIAQGYSMASLAGFLSTPAFGVGRPVLNKTGLTGMYDFTLNWSVYTAMPQMPSAVAGDASTPDGTISIFDALKEVGLQLQPATGPIDIIIIDHVEKPSAD